MILATAHALPHDTARQSFAVGMVHDSFYRRLALPWPAVEQFSTPGYAMRATTSPAREVGCVHQSGDRDSSTIEFDGGFTTGFLLCVSARCLGTGGLVPTMQSAGG